MRRSNQIPCRMTRNEAVSPRLEMKLLDSIPSRMTRNRHGRVAAIRDLFGPDTQRESFKAMQANVRPCLAWPMRMQQGALFRFTSNHIPSATSPRSRPLITSGSSPGGGIAPTHPSPSPPAPDFASAPVGWRYLVRWGGGCRMGRGASPGRTKRLGGRGHPGPRPPTPPPSDRRRRLHRRGRRGEPHCASLTHRRHSLSGGRRGVGPGGTPAL